MTLLHVVMEEASTKHQELLNIPQDLEIVIKCRTVSIDQLKNDYNKLSNNINKLSKQVFTQNIFLSRIIKFMTWLQINKSSFSVITVKINQQVSKGTEDIRKQFGEFLHNATKRFNAIDKNFEKVEELRKTLASYIVEDETKFKLEECFSTISNFCDQVIKYSLWKKHYIKNKIFL